MECALQLALTIFSSQLQAYVLNAIQTVSLVEVYPLTVYLATLFQFFRFCFKERVSLPVLIIVCKYKVFALLAKALVRHAAYQLPVVQAV